MTMIVSQDGRSFFNQNGLNIYNASIVVKDGDMKAAIQAREEFKAVAKRLNIDYKFE
jgi:hypothetical protein